MLNLNSIMLGSQDSKALAAFYEKVLGKKPDMVDGEWYGFATKSCFLSMGNHDKVTGTSANPERIIMNFETKDVKGEFERIKAAGATVIKEPYSMGEGDNAAWIATFADPEGNYFQLMTPWEG
jgi:predicted enzyme related to lactoylglutathione lyase